VLSYDELAPRSVPPADERIEKDLRSADETFDGLRHMKIDDLLGPALDRDARLREFIRGVFLSGNGAVLFNNSFIQWGAAEVLRRVQPQVLVCCFGIRQKLKPYSSLVLFEDQDRANPVPNALDPSGSLTDIQLLCDYVHLSAEGWPATASAPCICLQPWKATSFSCCPARFPARTLSPRRRSPSARSPKPASNGLLRPPGPPNRPLLTSSAKALFFP
jgi:hypothetical protein